MAVGNLEIQWTSISIAIYSKTIRHHHKTASEQSDRVLGKTHYSDVITSAMASQITSLTIVYSTIHSGSDQRKHQRAFKVQVYFHRRQYYHKGSLGSLAPHILMVKTVIANLLQSANSTLLIGAWKMCQKYSNTIFKFIIQTGSLTLVTTLLSCE